MKRRRQEKVQRVDPIDQQEQEIIIHDLEMQCLKDTQNTSNLLSYFCHAFAVISVLTFPYMHHYSTKFFSINASVVHIIAGSIAKSIACVGRNDDESLTKRTDDTLGYLGLGFAFCPFFLQCLSPVNDADEWIIKLLVVSNILTIITVSYMKIETRNSFLQLNQLKCSKYKYKSL
jgi:hypothetical protein